MTVVGADHAMIDWIEGDAIGLPFPAHGEALREGGEAFLTQAFRAFGALPADNAIARITRLEPCPGGSTGQKLFLSVAYERPDPTLDTDLFVKFSRDFTDPIRDRGRYEMEDEVRFAALSHEPGFPISVATAYFADYHKESGTGLLITRRIPFGTSGIEPHLEKTMDHLLDDALPYYRAILTSLARLAGAHRAGRLSTRVERDFPYDAQASARSDPIRFSTDELMAQVDDYAAFAARSPQLLPAHIRAPAFIARMRRDIPRFQAHEAVVKRFLQSNRDQVALCHWNAQIDNGWYWRDESGALQCGLLDWGRVRQLNLAFALWGSLSGAPLALWDEHLDDLLDLFIMEFEAHGGPRLDRAELRLHLDLYAALMGIAWLLEAPARIRFRLPEALDASGPHDPVFRKSETARNQLHIVSVLLNLWERHDFGARLDEMLARIS